MTALKLCKRTLYAQQNTLKYLRVERHDISNTLSNGSEKKKYKYIFLHIHTQSVSIYTYKNICGYICMYVYVSREYYKNKWDIYKYKTIMKTNMLYVNYTSS